MESPLCLNTAPNGLIGAAPDYYLGRNITRIPLSAELFARDSHCMVNPSNPNPSACWRRDTGRRIRVNIADFPAYADLVHAAEAHALYLRRAVAQHPRRGWRPHRGESRSPAPPALKRAKAGRPRWIWRLNGKRRPEAARTSAKIRQLPAFCTYRRFLCSFPRVKKGRPASFRVYPFTGVIPRTLSCPCNPFTFTLNAPPLAESVCHRR